jgi:uncharacterized protein YbbC (DUF1343 family)
MIFKLKLAQYFLFFIIINCTIKNAVPEVRVGLDRIDEFRFLFESKRIGIVTNHTAYNHQRQHISEVFLKMEGVTVSAFFGPEHGFRGEAERGVKLGAEYDSVLNIPIYSLYGKTRKPTPEMLRDVDVLVFDMQDIGARFYTYIYNMALSMEGAAEYGIPFVVLDRPNPLNGKMVEGNVLEPEFSNYMGLYPIPVRHGMTMGELAKMINQERWLSNRIKAELKIIPMTNWRREMWYDQTGLEFIKTSPNIPDLETAILYPGICLLEGTNISEGRGTFSPFKILGAPWIKGDQLANKLNDLNLTGVVFQDTFFTPISIPAMAKKPLYQNRRCFGVKMVVNNRDQFRPYSTGIQIINAVHQMYPDSLTWKIKSMQKLSGTNKIYQTIVNHQDLNDLFSSWEEELQKFLGIRIKYLLYN